MNKLVSKSISLENLNLSELDVSKSSKDNLEGFLENSRSVLEPGKRAVSSLQSCFIKLYLKMNAHE